MSPPDRQRPGQATAEIEKPGGWLRSVANHKVQDHYRAVARVRHLIDEAKQSAKSDEQEDPAKQSEIQEKRAEIRAAMDELSEQYRTPNIKPVSGDTRGARTNHLTVRLVVRWPWKAIVRQTMIED